MARETFADTQIPASGQAGVPYPDYQKIVRGLFQHGAEMVAGTVTGTGSALVVDELPFDPAAVIVWNQTDPGLFVHLPSFTAAHMAKLTDAPALTHATTNGITLGTKEFTIGADADMNAAADVLHWVAFGFRDGTLSE